MRHGHREEREHCRKPRNVISDTDGTEECEDILTSSSSPVFLLPRKTLGSLLLCTNNKAAGTSVRLNDGFCKTTDFWQVRTPILTVLTDLWHLLPGGASDFLS